MKHIEFIQVTIQAHFTQTIDCMVRTAKVTVKVAGEEEITAMELIDPSDFQSRFDWMLERIRNKIMEKCVSQGEQAS